MFSYSLKYIYAGCKLIVTFTILLSLILRYWFKRGDILVRPRAPYLNLDILMNILFPLFV
jgi:hypothetical protein